MLAIAWYKDSFINIWKFCARVWFTFTAILENIRSRVPTIEPFSEQSLKAQQKPSGPRPIPVARLPLLPKAYIFKHLKLYPGVLQLTLCIVSLHSSLKRQACFMGTASLVRDQQLVDIYHVPVIIPTTFQCPRSLFMTHSWCSHVMLSPRLSCFSRATLKSWGRG